MNKPRLEMLTDGVFAIVMTLLVLELKVPHIQDPTSSIQLFEGLKESGNIFFSFSLSFGVLTTYWVSHNFLITIISKNVNRLVVYINMLFLFFCSLVPFSTILLGELNNNRLAIILYGANVLAIGLVLMWMRIYVIKSPKIENYETNVLSDPIEAYYRQIRIWLPIISVLLGMLASFVSYQLTYALYIIPLAISLIPGSIAFLDNLIRVKILGIKKIPKRSGE